MIIMEFVDGKTLKVCNCNKTMALDAKALSSALGLSQPVRIHTELCRKEVAAFEAAARGITVVPTTGRNYAFARPVLEPLGFEVKEAVNGQEAIEVWERWEPHLIWMDMRMPVMDGYEVLRRLRAGPGTSDIPVIFVTALSESVDEALCYGWIDGIRRSVDGDAAGAGMQRDAVFPEFLPGHHALCFPVVGIEEDDPVHASHTGVYCRKHYGNISDIATSKRVKH